MHDDVPLREYLEALLHEHYRELNQRITDGDKRLEEHMRQQVGQIAAALAAAEKAIDKSDLATEKRFDSVNEFRGQLKDQVSTFLPREVADAQFSEIKESLLQQQSRLDMLQGKSTGSASTIGYMVAAATFVVSIITIGSRFIQ